MTYDVLLTTCWPHYFNGAPSVDDFPPIREAIALAPDLGLRVGRRGATWSDAVRDACSLPGMNFKLNHPVGGAYAFLRPIADEHRSRWDHDQAITKAVALSRLIHPTAITTEYAAQVTENDAGTPTEIIPGPTTGRMTQVYLDPSQTRQWLTVDEARELAILYTAFRSVQGTLPTRITRAMWNHEFVQYVREANVRWTIVATALEALVHTDRAGSTRQFVRRASALAAALGVAGFAEPEAARAYDLRSQIAHGGFAALGATELALYTVMETLLRRAVRQAITDSQFAAGFTSEATIRATWPV